MSIDPCTLDKIRKDSVNFLLGKLQEMKTAYFLDGDNHPCLEIKDDPGQQLQRVVDDTGRPSLRARSFLRSVFRYATEEKLHIGSPELALVVDYLVEEAFRGGRKAVRIDAAKDGDYNFEAVVVFANSLRSADDQEKGLGNRLLDEVMFGVMDPRVLPRVTTNAEQQTLVAELRTADLWRAVNSRQVECQVNADKATLFKAVNFFARRLTEMDEQFRKIGLEVTFCHKETGSWVTIRRQDRISLPDHAVLVTPDGTRSSSSGPSSGRNVNESKVLEASDDNRIEVEKPSAAAVA